jgi:hypothetical protein
MNDRFYTVSIQDCEGIFETNTKFADHFVWIRKFLFVFSLSQMLISKAAAIIAYVPPSLLVDGRRSC